MANWFTHLEIDWDSGVWAHWLDALVERRTLVRYDARGSGLSDRSVADLSLDASVADLEAVVEAAGLRRFPLIGLCQGGAVAVAYAARHPERVTRLVLYDSYLHDAYVGTRGGTSPSRHADVDVRGTLLVDRTVPVGFQEMECRVRLEPAVSTDADKLQMLIAAAEHSCVVLQTLRAGLPVVTHLQTSNALADG